MLYLYDNEICEDLRRSLNPNNMPNPAVSVLSGDEVLGVAAQLENDELQFPFICIIRDDDTGLDGDRFNFVRSHKGVAAVLDDETNELYYEKAVPVKLSYTLCIYATNTADRDEIVRELIFKYIEMYFLTIQLPYESSRKARFGVSIDPDMDIDYKSGSSEYLSQGTLYEADIHLRIDGAMMYHYTPARIRSFSHEIEVVE